MRPTDSAPGGLLPGDLSSVLPYPHGPASRASPAGRAGSAPTQGSSPPARTPGAVGAYRRVGAQRQDGEPDPEGVGGVGQDDLRRLSASGDLVPGGDRTPARQPCSSVATHRRTGARRQDGARGREDRGRRSGDDSRGLPGSRGLMPHAHGAVAETADGPGRQPNQALPTPQTEARRGERQGRADKAGGRVKAPLEIPMLSESPRPLVSFDENAFAMRDGPCQ